MNYCDVGQGGNLESDSVRETTNHALRKRDSADKTLVKLSPVDDPQKTKFIEELLRKKYGS